MNDFTIRSIAFSLISVVVPVVLRAISGTGGARGLSRLQYSKTARFFALFTFAPVVAVALAVTFQARPLHEGEGQAVLGLLLGFAAVGILLVLEFFRVVHDYGAAGVTYRSPWSPQRRIEWTSVAAISWRSSSKWLDLVPAGAGRRLHFSPMLGGLAPFAQIALERIPAQVLAAEPEAHAALRVMAAGCGRKLLMDARQPSQLATDLAIAQRR